MGLKMDVTAFFHTRSFLSLSPSLCLTSLSYPPFCLSCSLSLLSLGFIFFCPPSIVIFFYKITVSMASQSCNYNPLSLTIEVGMCGPGVNTALLLSNDKDLLVVCYWSLFGFVIQGTLQQPKPVWPS